MTPQLWWWIALGVSAVFILILVIVLFTIWCCLYHPYDPVRYSERLAREERRKRLERRLRQRRKVIRSNGGAGLPPDPSDPQAGVEGNELVSVTVRVDGRVVSERDAADSTPALKDGVHSRELTPTGSDESTPSPVTGSGQASAGPVCSTNAGNPLALSASETVGTRPRESTAASLPGTPKVARERLKKSGMPMTLAAYRESLGHSPHESVAGKDVVQRTVPLPVSETTPRLTHPASATGAVTASAAPTASDVGPRRRPRSASAPRPTASTPPLPPSSQLRHYGLTPVGGEPHAQPQPQPPPQQQPNARLAQLSPMSREGYARLHSSPALLSGLLGSRTRSREGVHVTFLDDVAPPSGSDTPGAGPAPLLAEPKPVRESLSNGLPTRAGPPASHEARMNSDVPPVAPAPAPAALPSAGVLPRLRAGSASAARGDGRASGVGDYHSFLTPAITAAVGRGSSTSTLDVDGDTDTQGGTRADSFSRELTSPAPGVGPLDTTAPPPQPLPLRPSPPRLRSVEHERMPLPRTASAPSGPRELPRSPVVGDTAPSPPERSTLVADTPERPTPPRGLAVPDSPLYNGDGAADGGTPMKGTGDNSSVLSDAETIAAPRLHHGHDFLAKTMPPSDGSRGSPHPLSGPLLAATARALRISPRRLSMERRGGGGGGGGDNRNGGPAPVPSAMVPPAVKDARASAGVHMPSSTSPSSTSPSVALYRSVAPAVARHGTPPTEVRAAVPPPPPPPAVSRTLPPGGAGAGEPAAAVPLPTTSVSSQRSRSSSGIRVLMITPAGGGPSYVPPEAPFPALGSAIVPPQTWEPSSGRPPVVAPASVLPHQPLSHGGRRRASASEPRGHGGADGRHTGHADSSGGMTITNSLLRQYQAATGGGGGRYGSHGSLPGRGVSGSGISSVRGGTTGLRPSDTYGRQS